MLALCKTVASAQFSSRLCLLSFSRQFLLRGLLCSDFSALCRRLLCTGSPFLRRHRLETPLAADPHQSPFTTLIDLPKNEQILEFICGDKEFWIVNGAQNFAFVKPAKPRSETNLNLITAAGNVYSFVLREVGEGART